MGELTCLESISGGGSDIAIEISHALDVSLSEIQAQIVMRAMKWSGI
jgi:hypothetical protein